MMQTPPRSNDEYDSIISSLADSCGVDGFYRSLGQADCLERLQLDFSAGSVATVTGQPGIGKSILLQVYLAEMAERERAVVVTKTASLVTDMQLLDELLSGMDAARGGRTILDRSSQFGKQVRAAGKNGVTTTIVIDDAHRLSGSQLDILRTLIIEPSNRSSLRLLLAGEDVVRDRLDRKRSLAEQVKIQHVLNPLNTRDSIGLINHRIAMASPSRPVFTDFALEELHRFSVGVPGQMLPLAIAAVQAAHDQRLPMVTDHEVRSSVSMSAHAENFKFRSPRSDRIDTANISDDRFIEDTERR